MPPKLREYPGQGITITFNARRCIHSEECVHRLPGVFDPQRRVWVDATQADPDDLARVVCHCPTGALHFQRTDGSADEQVPERNEVRVAADGPLFLRGDLEIHGADGVIRETRAALCRCGASANKPFCDNSHQRVELHDASQARSSDEEGRRASGTVRVLPQPNGPCVVEGVVAIVDKAGHLVATIGPRTALCRCGQSGNKPFCDGSHKRVGFTA
jgi:CDGSH-type Zn-finger protein/uncharacterized Fe-S cluster protein YjdI